MVSMAADGAASGRRFEVLAEAGRLFSERGYHATTMRDIAKACNVQPASLYGHFPSKESLLVELVHRYFDAATAAMRSAVDHTATGAAQLAMLMEALIGAGMANRTEFMVVANDWNHVLQTPALSDLLLRRDEVLDLLRGALERGIDDRSLRADLEVEAVLWILTSLVAGMVDERFEHRLVDDTSPPVRTMLSVVFDGLAA
ncbi:MAG: TetR/AcrR family transcriptional regulator [Acidobacteria bacterium]|nr:TetR/AcrR family transcriptional regulator [Acidobacteriota bacterium]